MDEGPIRAIEEAGAVLAEFIRDQGPGREELRDLANQACAGARVAVHESRRVRAGIAARRAAAQP
jgi:hypothetical protein